MFEIIIIVILCAICAIMLGTNIKLFNELIAVENTAIEAIETCDEAIASIDRLLEMPVTMNSPEVHDVLLKLKNVRKGVVDVAVMMGVSIEEDDG